MPAETVDIHITLRVSERARKKLVERAAQSGTDVAEYVSTIVEQNTLEPLSVEVISGQVYERFLESGTTDEELSEELEQAKHEMRAERRSRRAS
jgi:hypothetical protein